MWHCLHDPHIIATSRTLSTPYRNPETEPECVVCNYVSVRNALFGAVRVASFVAQSVLGVSPLSSVFSFISAPEPLAAHFSVSTSLALSPYRTPLSRGFGLPVRDNVPKASCDG